MKHGKILALDFAWRATGWVVINEDGKPFKWGVIKTKPRKKKNKSDKNPIADLKHEVKNYYQIRKNLLDILDLDLPEQCLNDVPVMGEKEMYDMKIVEVVAEVTYFSQKASDGILIGMGWSLLSEFFAEFFTATQVKHLLLGQDNKNASKTDVAKYVIKNGGLKLQLERDHIKDAYAVYLAWNKTRQLTGQS